jgi:Xaa-Pro aminopeptidase
MTIRQPEYALFPTEEYLERVKKARIKMDKLGIDALILTAKENVIYFSGIRTIGWGSKHRPMGIIIPKANDKPVISVLPETLFEVSLHSSWIDEIHLWGGWRRKDAATDSLSAFADACRFLGVDSDVIGLEIGYGQRIGMSQEDFLNLQSKLLRAKFVDASALIWDLRMIKSPLEIDAIRKACKATDKAFEIGFNSIRPGMTERDLAGIILAELALQTGEMPGFIMVRSGKLKYGMVNVEPFEKPIEPGDLVVVDIGANYKYYWSDFMRMASIGEPSREQIYLFEAELASQKAGVSVIKPGIKLHEVFDECYNVLIDMGVKNHVPGLERVGHGIGLDVHEPPSIARGSETVVMVNMVLTVEPIFWDQPNHEIGNFAIEDNLVVTEDGFEILSTFPKELFIIS